MIHDCADTERLEESLFSNYYERAFLRLPEDHMFPVFDDTVLSYNVLRFSITHVFQ